MSASCELSDISTRLDQHPLSKLGIKRSSSSPTKPGGGCRATRSMLGRALHVGQLRTLTRNPRRGRSAQWRGRDLARRGRSGIGVPPGGRRVQGRGALQARRWPGRGRAWRAGAAAGRGPGAQGGLGPTRRRLSSPRSYHPLAPAPQSPRSAAPVHRPEGRVTALSSTHTLLNESPRTAGTAVSDAL